MKISRVSVNRCCLFRLVAQCNFDFEDPRESWDGNSDASAKTLVGVFFSTVIHCKQGPMAAAGVSGRGAKESGDVRAQRGGVPLHTTHEDKQSIEMEGRTFGEAVSRPNGQRRAASFRFVYYGVGDAALVLGF